MTGVGDFDFIETRIGFGDPGTGNVLSNRVSPQWIQLSEESDQGDEFVTLCSTDRKEVELENAERNPAFLRRGKWLRVR